jgi:hypothetical protein
VTIGSNGSGGCSYLCEAGVGYDGPTGLGTPNGVLAFGPGAASNDFSIAVSPTSGTADAGVSGATTTVSTATTSGSAQPLYLSASGLPYGASASFAPSSVMSGRTSTLTISTTELTPAGSFPITIKSGSHTTTYTLTVTNPIPVCPSPGQKLGNPGFESGNTVWETIWPSTAGVIGQWGGSGEPTHGGTWDARLDGTGTTHTDTVTQWVTIPSGCANYTLSFWLHVDSSETTTTTQSDTLNVSVGSITLATYSNLDKASGYTQHSINLFAYAGKSVPLTFTGTENSSLQTTFVVDDTALNVS